MFISHSPIVLSSIPKNNLSRSVAVLWDVILISTHQLPSCPAQARVLKVFNDDEIDAQKWRKMRGKYGRSDDVQVDPSLLSITSPNPLSNLLHISPSSSFSQIPCTQSTSLSVISSGKENVGKRSRKWVLVERELCWPPEIDSRKFCHLVFSAPRSCQVRIDGSPQ